MKKLICFFSLLILVCLPFCVFATHTGPRGSQVGPNITLPTNHDYLIFKQKSMKHFGIVYGGTSLTVEKKNNGWVYFTLECLVDGEDFIDDSTLAKNTMLFSLPPVVKVNEPVLGVDAYVVLIDSLNHVAKLFNDTKVQNAGMNTVVIKGKIYVGTAKKKVLPKVEKSYEDSSEGM